MSGSLRLPHLSVALIVAALGCGDVGETDVDSVVNNAVLLEGHGFA